jgi:lysozyme
MKTSPNGRKLIESFEGCILQSYDDYNDHIVKEGDPVHGVLTIGYGHTSAAGLPVVTQGMVITKNDADVYLSMDLGKVERTVESLVKVPLTQNQFDALVSFEYNTGALGHSSILTVLNEKDYNTAADRILLYDKAKGRVLAGLQRRRQSERTLFLKSEGKDVTVPTSVPTGSGNSLIDFILNLFANFFKKGK